VIRWSSSGEDHPSSHGLSIYWPHDQDIEDPTPKSPGPGGERPARLTTTRSSIRQPATRTSTLVMRRSDPGLRDIDHRCATCQVSLPARFDLGRVPPALLQAGRGRLHRLWRRLRRATRRAGRRGSRTQWADPQIATGPKVRRTTSRPTLQRGANTITGISTPRATIRSKPDYQDDILYGDCEDEDCDREAPTNRMTTSTMSGQAWSSAG
jgi:hypothetical protein